MPGADRVTCSRANSNGVVPAVIRPRRIVAECILAPKFFRDRLENFLDLTASPDQAFGQQECATTTVFGKSPQNTHIDFVAFARDAGFSSDQARQRPTPSISVGTLRVGKRRDADWVDDQVRYTNALEDILQPGGAGGVLSVGNQKDGSFGMTAGGDLRNALRHRVVQCGAAGRDDSLQGFRKLFTVICEILSNDRSSGKRH